LSDSDNS